MNKIFLAALPFAALVGCGGDDGKTVVVTPDAKVQPQPDAFVPVECKAQETYTAFSSPGLYAVDRPVNGQTPHYQNLQGELKMGTGNSDILSMYLVQNPAEADSAFAGGIAPGTYMFDRTMDASIDMYIWPQLGDEVTTLPQDYLDNERYLAFEGTLVLNESSGTVGQNMSGMITTAEFVHVHASGTTLMAADDDGMGNTCVSTITNLAFSTMYRAPALTATSEIKVSLKNIGQKFVKTNR